MKVLFEFSLCNALEDRIETVRMDFSIDLDTWILEGIAESIKSEIFLDPNSWEVKIAIDMQNQINEPL